ncbi:MAG: Mov34/MPN/PAD-1 family protein [Sphingomonadaceae bacterium]
MTVQISRALIDRMIAHAASDPLREVCGLLLGAGHGVADMQACANAAADPATSFEIDPAALIAAHKAARAGGLAVIGCYHSHPNGVLALSPHDLASAYEGQIWVLIVRGSVGMWVKENGMMVAGEGTPI